MGTLGIVIALLTLILLAYRGYSVIVLAPLAALLAVVLQFDAPILASYTQVFMTATGRFIAQFFPLFLLGALFGRFMEDSGAAQAIARQLTQWLGPPNAVLAIVLACAALTYGGVSLFVVAFAVFPIAAAMFREANIPRRLIPATIALGAFTFTMTALPGTPAIQNAIPMPHFGTTPFAAPGLGVIAGLIMFGLGMGWLLFRTRQAARTGEGYGEAPAEQQAGDRKEIREYAQSEGYDVMEIDEPDNGEAPPAMGLTLALSPIVLVVVLNYVLSTLVFPAMEADYLALPQYGATSIDSVAGIWAIICALTAANLYLIAISGRLRSGFRKSLDNGANAAVAPILNTASLVGFGAVVATLSGFVVVRDTVLGLSPDNPLISLAVAVNVLAGITGSASGGMSIALDVLGQTYLEMARDLGMNPELLHRVTAIATGGLDALPHNGAVITLLSICGLSHRQSYGDIAVVAVLCPIVALVAVIVLGSVFGSF
ncbi:MAG: GntP family permease [Ectothiorhodospiraceae bacterium]|nr:GntP family permease [Ectothiorhodospiraceae bacterium]MCH8504909.1 GntP family permease [Ectothiorhodospiraceae bacterium]